MCHVYAPDERAGNHVWRWQYTTLREGGVLSSSNHTYVSKVRQTSVLHHNISLAAENAARVDPTTSKQNPLLKVRTSLTLGPYNPESPWRGGLFIVLSVSPPDLPSKKVMIWWFSSANHCLGANGLRGSHPHCGRTLPMVVVGQTVHRS